MTIWMSALKILDGTMAEPDTAGHDARGLPNSFITCVGAAITIQSAGATSPCMRLTRDDELDVSQRGKAPSASLLTTISGDTVQHFGRHTKEVR